MKAISTIEKDFGELEAIMIVASDGNRVLNIGDGKLVKAISNSIAESKEFEDLISLSVETAKQKKLMMKLEPELRQLASKLKELQGETPDTTESQSVSYGEKNDAFSPEEMNETLKEIQSEIGEPPAQMTQEYLVKAAKAFMRKEIEKNGVSIIL